MLGKEYSLLKNSSFGFFVSSDTRPVFNLFLEKVFSSKAKESCEVTLSGKGSSPIFVNISGCAVENEEHCLLIALDISRRRQVEDTQTFLLKCGYPGTNEDFFESLARYLAQSLNMDYVCIDRLDGDGLTAQTVAIYNDGKFDSNASYALKETPCGDVVGKTICCFTENVCQMFPNDTALRELKAESYIGTTLWSFDGKPIGLIAVIGRKPLENPSLAEAMLKVVAVRASGEMERKMAEEAIRESELKFRKYIDFAPHGVFVANEIGEYIDVNSSACKITGYSKDELLSMKIIDLIPEESLEIAANHFNRVAKEGFATGEFPFIKKDSSKGFLSVDAVKLSENMLLGFVVDITERKQAENAIKKLNEELEDRVTERTAELLKSHNRILLAEEKYRTIADYNYDWETWLSPEGKYIYVSPSCYRISGYSVDEFMNDPTLFYKIAHPGDREMVETHFYDSLKGDNSDICLDFRIITRNGEEKWISHCCQSVYNKEGQWLGQRGSDNDITERKKAESFLLNSQDKLRALTQHLNELTEKERINIAREIHDELGHMLTALKYDIDNLMSNSELTVELVNNELPVMFGMVESLIDSVKKIATELRPGILDHLGLFPAMEWQINQFRMLTKIKCTYVIPADLDVTFNKNETTTIFRILQEILTNVARHSKAKEVIISVHKQNDIFLMNVNDNGVGFKPIDNIQTGSLGLTGMHERALSIGGEIQIESAPGKGTSITLLLNKK